jgi:hypothetical protein
MEATMNTFVIRSLTFTAGLAALIVTSTAADAHPAYKHKPAHQFPQTLLIPWTATALATEPAVVPMSETDGLSRNPDDCNHGCIDNN